jgi:hypothetical protein
MNRPAASGQRNQDCARFFKVGLSSSSEAKAVLRPSPADQALNRSI